MEQPANQVEKHDRLGRWRSIGLVLLLLLVFALLYSQTVADPDLWGHLRFGRDTWESGQISRQDPYSYLTTDQTWINHEWLTEVIFWRTFAMVGARGLAILKLTIGLLTTGILYAHLRRCQISSMKAAILLLVLTALPLWLFLVTIRPQLFTLLFFTLAILIICRAEQGHLGSLWLLVPLFVVWANCHGGFLAGIGVLALWACARIVQWVIQRDRIPIHPRTALALLGPIAVAVAATLLNPYGLRLWAFLLRTATVARPEIREWQPVALISNTGISYLVPLGLTITGLLYSRLERRPALIAVYVCTAFLPLLANRHLPLFAVAATVIAGEHVHEVWARWLPRRGAIPKARSAWRLLPWLTFLSIFGTAVLVPLLLYRLSGVQTPLSCIQLLKAYYPVRAVALMKATVPAGNLAVDFDWGEYALWYLGPEVKVSVDGRRETVYSEEIYQQNLRFMRGEGEWDTLLVAHKTDLALVRAKGPTHNLLRLKPDWVVVYEDPVSALFVREDSPLRERLQAASPPEIPYDGQGLCFP